MKKIIMIICMLTVFGFIAGSAFGQTLWYDNSGVTETYDNSDVKVTDELEVGGDLSVDGDISIGSTGGSISMGSYAMMGATDDWYGGPFLTFLINDSVNFNTRLSLWGEGILAQSGGDVLMAMGPDGAWFKSPFHINSGYPETGIEFKIATTGIAGSGTISSSGTTVTGTNTAFISEIKVGDEIAVTVEIARKVTAIASDTSLTVDAAFDDDLSSESYTISTVAMRVDSNGDLEVHGKITTNSLVGTGTISTSGTTVTGTSTSFITEIDEGDEIIVGVESRRVESIATNTSLTITEAFDETISGDTFSIRNVPIRTDSDGDLEINGKTVNITSPGDICIGDCD